MSMIDIVKRSRSFRRFDQKHRLSRNALKQLINLARHSPSARNQQALKFLISNSSGKNNLIFSALAWAGALSGWKGPGQGERPSAYIVILGDRRISDDFSCDHGIAAQSIMLGAAEMGLGGCIIGSIDREALKKKLNIADHFRILLVIALGKPAEKVVLENVRSGSGVRYYRDAKGVHHVPKRSLKDLIIG